MSAFDRPKESGGSVSASSHLYTDSTDAMQKDSLDIKPSRWSRSSLVNTPEGEHRPLCTLPSTDSVSIYASKERDPRASSLGRVFGKPYRGHRLPSQKANCGA
jgi:hypothetical protein